MLIILGLSFLMFLLFATNPMLIFISYFSAFYLLPYGFLRISDSPLPVFKSVTNGVAIVGLFAALFNFIIRRKKFIFDNLHLAIFAYVLVLFMGLVIGHGPAASDRLMSFLKAFLPFFLVILLVSNTKQLKIIILSLIAPLLLKSTVEMVKIITLIKNFGLGLSYRHLASMYTDQPIAWQPFSVYASIAIICLAVTLYTRDKKLFKWALISSFMLSLVIIFSGFLTSLVILTLGFALLTFYGKKYNLFRKYSPFFIAVWTIMSLWIIFRFATHIVNRIANIQEDYSAQARISVFFDGIHAFFDSPLMGWGAYDEEYITSTGRQLGGHSGVVVIGYEYGLMLLIPFLTLIFLILKRTLRLNASLDDIEEKTLAVGITASLWTMSLAHIFFTTFFVIPIESIFWLLAGVVVVWNRIQMQK